ncbi:MAG: hypothetical protein ABSB80_04115 [Methanoregula sp.]|uniref:hypothetical protein n=1 Tax=Methanoregula sp. TaxID=2052170 RepID=UPI003D0A4B68
MNTSWESSRVAQEWRENDPAPASRQKSIYPGIFRRYPGTSDPTKYRNEYIEYTKDCVSRHRNKAREIRDTLRFVREGAGSRGLRRCRGAEVVWHL